MFGQWMGNDRIDLELDKTSKNYDEGYIEGKTFVDDEWRSKIKKEDVKLETFIQDLIKADLVEKVKEDK